MKRRWQTLPAEQNDQVYILSSEWGWYNPIGLPHLRLDKTALTITVAALPIPGKIPIICDLPQVIEFYSR